jgi:hypothetical protein
LITPFVMHSKAIKLLSDVWQIQVYLRIYNGLFEKFLSVSCFVNWVSLPSTFSSYLWNKHKTLISFYLRL